MSTDPGRIRTSRVFRSVVVVTTLVRLTSANFVRPVSLARASTVPRSPSPHGCSTRSTIAAGTGPSRVQPGLVPSAVRSCSRHPENSRTTLRSAATSRNGSASRCTCTAASAGTVKPRVRAGSSSRSRRALWSSARTVVTTSQTRSRWPGWAAAIATVAPAPSWTERIAPCTRTRVPKTCASGSSTSSRAAPAVQRCDASRSSRASSLSTRNQRGSDAAGRRSARIVMSSTSRHTSCPVPSRTSKPRDRCRNVPIPGTSDGSLSTCHTGTAVPSWPPTSSSASTCRLDPGGASSSASMPSRCNGAGPAATCPADPAPLPVAPSITGGTAGPRPG